MAKVTTKPLRSPHNPREGSDGTRAAHVNSVQIICSIGRERMDSQSSATWNGSEVNRPTCSSGFTNAAKSENAVGVGFLIATSGDTWYA